VRSKPNQRMHRTDWHLLASFQCCLPPVMLTVSPLPLDSKFDKLKN
jgi:hypothetical protein